MKEETRRKREREGKEKGGEGGWRSRKCVEVVKSGRLQEREREREKERERERKRDRERANTPIGISNLMFYLCIQEGLV